MENVVNETDEIRHPSCGCMWDGANPVTCPAHVYPRPKRRQS